MKTCKSIFTLKLAPALFVLLSGGAFAGSDAVLTIGGGAALAPRYSGSDENMALPMLLLDYSTASGFYASTMRGLGYGGSAGPFSYSAALGFRAPRKENGELPFGGKASKYLRGMGDVKGSATANLSAGYAIFEGLTVNLHTAQALSARETGGTYGAGLTGTLFKDAGNTVTLSLGFEMADKKYAQTYYGVSAQQALKSGYKVYKPKAGMYQADVAMSWQHKVDERWAVTGMLGVSGLLRDAANSPLTRRTTSPTAAVYASYGF
ncbi:MipA/OmpV family protein [Pseudoduganella aquatica]|uniref:MipA/OmpV family protein n=1 Tax=Pseudoduganella aquatica TaxID=2660641 RepID=A0A7X4HEB0_9BURK|nr:MipA/OmpV family protein [Pseudoduganella aquatica]MYN08807.1 MipA/OmpV family protein [Pseudoduganella aquatica]